MATNKARYSIGQVVHHRLYDYRAVIVDVDPIYQGTDHWYDTMAASQPPKDMPWYHVLVHGAIHRGYVAQCNIEPDTSGEPVDHPELENYFGEFDDGVYQLKGSKN